MNTRLQLTYWRLTHTAFRVVVWTAIATAGCSNGPTGIVSALAERDNDNVTTLWSAGNDRVVEVLASDAADLYRKLLHPAFSGRTLRLKGHYGLSRVAAQRALDQLHADGITNEQLDPTALEAISLGYLDLGNRHIEGQNDVVSVDGIAHHVETDVISGETIIDGDGLASSVISLDHYRDPDLKFLENRPLVRARQDNTIKGVTLKWRRMSNVIHQTISLEGRGGRVEECRFDVPQIDIGVLVSARGKNAEGTDVSAQIIGNIGDSAIQLGFVVASTLFTRDARTTVHLEGNDARRMVALHQPGSERGLVQVYSRHNRYTSLPRTDGDILPGILARGGLAPDQYTNALNNRIEILSQGDRFALGPGVPPSPGITIRGGAGGVATSNTASGNVVDVTLISPVFLGTTIDVAGAENRAHDNLVTLHVRQASALPAQVVTATFNLGAATGNKIEIIGSRRAWEATNGGLIPPPPGYFLSRR